MVLPEFDATLDIQKSSNQRAVRINPEVWTSYDAISAVLPEPAGSYSRTDLKKLVSHAFSENDRHLISELFVKTMMWGSGTTNGRGPRYTSKALVAGKPVEVLIKVRELLLSSQISEAYDLHHEIPGVGPSFHTKFLWVVGSDIPYLKPRPLILDDLVWKGLKAIGWSSIKAAGTIRRGKRYVAYLEACEQWASEEDWQPEDVEYSLYLLGNKS